MGGQTFLLAVCLAEQNPGGEGEGAARRAGREGGPGPPGRNEAPGLVAEGQHLGSKLTAARCDPCRASPELGTLVLWGTMQTSCSPPVCAPLVFVGHTSPCGPVRPGAGRHPKAGTLSWLPCPGSHGLLANLVQVPPSSWAHACSLPGCCRPTSSSCPFSPGWGGLPAGATLGYPPSLHPLLLKPPESSAFIKLSSIAPSK